MKSFSEMALLLFFDTGMPIPVANKPAYFMFERKDLNKILYS